MVKKTEAFILSLGGSLIVPNGGIGIQFLRDFNALIRRQVQKGRRFFIVTGGGGTTRHYQQAAREIITDVADADLDWLGIHSTRLNGHLVRTIFKDIARPKMIEHYDEKEEVGDYPVVIGSGWKPGWSTDYCATYLCKNYGAKTLVNLSNIKKVYDQDPKTHPDAKPLDQISWKDYRQMVGDIWTPGLNRPFDPIASKLAEELQMRVIVLEGKNLTNLESLLDGGDFEGTVIGV